MPCARRRFWFSLAAPMPSAAIICRLPARRRPPCISQRRRRNLQRWLLSRHLRQRPLRQRRLSVRTSRNLPRFATRTVVLNNEVHKLQARLAALQGEPDQVRSLRKSLDGLKAGFETEKADYKAQIAQLTAKLDHAHTRLRPKRRASRVSTPKPFKRRSTMRRGPRPRRAIRPARSRMRPRRRPRHARLCRDAAPCIAAAQ